MLWTLSQVASCNSQHASRWLWQWVQNCALQRTKIEENWMHNGQTNKYIDEYFENCDGAENDQVL